MQVALIRVSPNGQSQRVPVARERTLIGRNDECHIRIRSAGISRQHCEVLIKDGSLMVQDLGSSNGTYVNQDRIKSQPVSAGDLVSVGELVFVVEVNGEPGDIDAGFLFEEGLPVPAESTQQEQQAPSLIPAGNANEESSMMDFQFDLDEDEDDQPPL